MADHPVDAIVVCVWLPEASLLDNFRGRFGHATLKLVGPSFRRLDDMDRYVSYWPAASFDVKKSILLGRYGKGDVEGAPGEDYRTDKASELGERAMARLRAGWIPRPDQRLLWMPVASEVDAVPGAAVRADGFAPRSEWVWGRSADLKVVLPVMSEGGTSYGLNASAIVEWWRVFRSASALRWNVARRNCSSIVVAALEAGGSEHVLPSPRTTYMRPSVVARWVKELASTLDRRRLQIQELLGTRQVQELASAVPWSAEQWRKHSTRAHHRRAAQYQAVDGLLAEYHGVARGPGARGEILFKILDALHDKVIKHPDIHGQRAAAITLSRQCVLALDGLKARH